MGAGQGLSGSRVASTDRRRVHDDAVALSLPWLCWCLSVLFLGIAVGQATMEGSNSATSLVAIAAIAAAVSAVVAEAARRGWIPPGRAQLALSALVLLSTAFALRQLALTHDLSTTTALMLTMIGTGAGLVSARWVLGWVAVMWLGWLVVAAPITAPRTDWTRWTLALLSATFLAVLVSSVRRRGIDALSDAVRQAEEAAVRDPLTGLTNRRGLELLALPLLEGARRRGDVVHCMFVDVDRLKEVNDSRGHEAGDALLVAVAAALESVTRSSDVVARWAGDEFCVLGLGSGMPPGELEARVRAHVATAQEGSTPMSVSVGSASVEPWDERSIDQLLAAADREMYSRRAHRSIDLAAQPARDPDSALPTD